MYIKLSNNMGAVLRRMENHTEVRFVIACKRCEI